MASLRLISSFLLCAFTVSLVASASSKSLIKLNDENWHDVLQGEWMVEFQSPQCPVCKSSAKDWNAFAEWSRDLNVKVADVDVTNYPGLAGRFWVESVPMIYHVKDGVFRVYNGQTSKEDYIAYVQEKEWAKTAPVPWYLKPTSPQMAVFSTILDLSAFFHDLQTYLVEEIGIPWWASYALFAIVSVNIVSTLLFLIVCLVDAMYPQKTNIDKLVKTVEDESNTEQTEDANDDVKESVNGDGNGDSDATNDELSEETANSTDDSTVKRNIIGEKTIVKQTAVGKKKRRANKID